MRAMQSVWVLLALVVTLALPLVSLQGVSVAWAQGATVAGGGCPAAPPSGPFVEAARGAVGHDLDVGSAAGGADPQELRGQGPPGAATVQSRGDRDGGEVGDRGTGCGAGDTWAAEPSQVGGRTGT